MPNHAKSGTPAPLPQILRSRIAAAVKADGEEPTRKRIGLARDSFARAFGGLSVSRGTAAIVREHFPDDVAADTAARLASR